MLQTTEHTKDTMDFEVAVYIVHLENQKELMGIHYNII
jgi:hypothetical protein